MAQRTKPESLTRRRVLGGAAAAPFAAPLLLVGCEGPDAGGGPTVRDLESATSMTNHPLPAERLPAILPAVRMNHAFFRAVRELEIPDLTEPAVLFVARGTGDRETDS